MDQRDILLISQWLRKTEQQRKKNPYFIRNHKRCLKSQTLRDKMANEWTCMRPYHQIYLSNRKQTTFSQIRSFVWFLLPLSYCHSCCCYFYYFGYRCLLAAVIWIVSLSNFFVFSRSVSSKHTCSFFFLTRICASVPVLLFFVSLLPHYIFVSQ